MLKIQEEYVKRSKQLSDLENELTLRYLKFNPFFFHSFMVNISLRPTQDDIDLLKKELVQVQQLTDTIVREKENENKHLKRDYDNMKRNLEEY